MKVNEVRGDLAKILNPDDPQDVAVLRLLIARDALLFAHVTYLEASTREDAHAAALKPYWATRRTFAFTVTAGFLYEALKAFRDLDKVQWFEKFLPPAADQRERAENALRELRSAVARRTCLAWFRDKASFHWDGDVLRECFRGMTVDGVEVAVFHSTGDQRHQVCSPLAAELLTRMGAANPEHDWHEALELVARASAWLLDLTETCVTECLRQRGVVVRSIGK